jgi:transposase InsO family protein
LDNGGEYTSIDLNYFYTEEGIKRELTIPYKPQQNGISKRKNRSIIDYVRAMMYDQEFPMVFW